MIDFRIVGTKEVMRRLNGFTRVLRLQNKKAMEQAAIETANKSKSEYLSGPRPAKLGVLTGRLRSSITHQVTGQGKDLVGEVGTNVIYGRVHEFGYPERNIPARPFLNPALTDMERRVIELFGGAVQIAIRRQG